MTSSFILFFSFVLGLSLIGLIIFLVVKHIQFIVSSIPLYKEMVSNQAMMIKAIKETNDEIRSLHHSNIVKQNGHSEPITLKEINV